MVAVLVGSGVFLALLVGLRALRSTGVLPVWRIRRTTGLTCPQHEAERARILAMPVDELADEIMRASGWQPPEKSQP